MSDVSAHIMVAVAVTATTIGLYVASKPRREGPPIAKMSFWSFFTQLTDPGMAVGLLRKLGEEEPPIIRFSTPFFLPEFWVVRDWKAMNQMYLGDVATKTEAGDKHPMVYQGVALLTGGIPNMVSKRTDGEGAVEGWSWARKATSPAFSYKNVLLRFEAMQGIVQGAMADFLGQEQDVTKLMCRVTFKVMMDTMMGTLADTQTGEDKSDWFIECSKVAMNEFAIKSAMNPVRHRMFWDKDVRHGHACVQDLHALSQNMLDRYRSVSDADKDSASVASSLIAMIDKAPYNSDKERAADLTTFMIGGIETTAFGATFATSLLAKHPLSLRRLRTELDSVNPTRGPWTPGQLSALPYLQCVIKETLRLYSPAPWHTRDFKRGGTIGGFSVPKGTVILANLYMAGRHGVTEEADAFRPERHEGANVDSAVLEENDPWSKGKRACPGKELSLLELKLILATFAQKLDFEQTTKELTLWNMGTLEPRGAIFNVTPRASGQAVTSAQGA